MTKTIKGVAKHGIYSSQGLSTIIFKDGKQLMFNHKKSDKIKGPHINNSAELEMWLSNSLRVFTRTEVILHDQCVEINFVDEEISFTAPRVTVDDFKYHYAISKDWYDESKLV